MRPSLGLDLHRVALALWFPSRCDFAPLGHLEIPGSIFDCHDWGKGAIGINWVNARDAAKHPIMHRTDPRKTMIWSIMSVVPWLRNPDLKDA